MASELSESNILRKAEELLVDRAQLLTLTPPEMTVLIVGLRVLNTNVVQSGTGIYHGRKLLTTISRQLLEMGTIWKPTMRNVIV
jgi:catalase-peroxidase